MAVLRRTAWLATLAFAPLTVSNGACAADVNVTANVSTGINLDADTGSTVEIEPGVSVTNAAFAAPVLATANVWTVTNRGSISSAGADAISLSPAGSSVINFSSITAGTSTIGNLVVIGYGIELKGGGSVDNRAGATISSSSRAISIGTAGPGSGAGTVINAGTIQHTMTTTDDLVVLLNGGTVTNLEGGSLIGGGSTDTVSITSGTSRTVINSGIITNVKTGYATAISLQGGAGTVTNNATGQISSAAYGIRAFATAPLTLTNDGLIESTGSGVTARAAVQAEGGGTVVNTGTMRSVSGDGLYLGQTGTITNSGTITGATNAIEFAGNYGHTLNLDTGSVLNGLVQGGTGVDTLVLLGTGTESAAKFLAFEKLSMQGAAWQLNGAGTFSTSADVQSGTLTVAGTLTSPAITIQSTGTLTGSGTLVGAVSNYGTVRLASNALTVIGSYTSEGGSVLEVAVTPTTNVQLVVTGTASINGGTVAVQAGSGNYAPSTVYTILTSGGLTGTFSGVTSNFAFLTPSLSYEGDNVYLTLHRNGLDFSAVGGTPNQRATGGAVEPLGSGNAIYDAVEQLDEPGARNAFDMLSGEIHASTKGMLVQDSRFIRDAVTSRISAAFGNGGETTLPVMAYGEGGPEMAAADTDRFAVWGQAFGSWSNTNSDGNAAAFDRSAGGLLVGADGLVGDWRVGVVGGYSRTSFNADVRQSSGDSDNYHLGLYGGTKWGALAFRSGLAYAWHRLSTQRSVVFDGFADALSANYNAGTAQAFGEFAYDVNAGRMALEPFANLAHVSLHTDGFAEKGGTAALSSTASTTDTSFTTAGVRASADLSLGGIAASAHGTLGWRHAFGDVTPMSDLTFAGGNTFSIAGAPIARDAAFVEAGIDLALGARAKLGLNYSGQFGSGVSDNGFKAALGVSF